MMLTVAVFLIWICVAIYRDEDEIDEIEDEGKKDEYQIFVVEGKKVQDQHGLDVIEAKS